MNCVQILSFQSCRSLFHLGNRVYMGPVGSALLEPPNFIVDNCRRRVVCLFFWACRLRCRALLSSKISSSYLSDCQRLTLGSRSTVSSSSFKYVSLLSHYHFSLKGRHSHASPGSHRLSLLIHESLYADALPYATIRCPILLAPRVYRVCEFQVRHHAS